VALPTLATVADLASWVGEPIDDGNSRAQRLLVAASARVRSFTGQTWLDSEGALTEVPDEVHTVTLQVAERKWRNPSGSVHETAGPFSNRWSERAADGIYLTEDEKSMLDSHRVNRRALWNLRAEKDDAYLEDILRDTVFDPVEGSSEPFPAFDKYDLGPY